MFGAEVYGAYTRLPSTAHAYQMYASGKCTRLAGISRAS